MYYYEKKLKNVSISEVKILLKYAHKCSHRNMKYFIKVPISYILPLASLADCS